MREGVRSVLLCRESNSTDSRRSSTSHTLEASGDGQSNAEADNWLSKVRQLDRPWKHGHDVTGERVQRCDDYRRNNDRWADELVPWESRVPPGDAGDRFGYHEAVDGSEDHRQEAEATQRDCSGKRDHKSDADCPRDPFRIYANRSEEMVGRTLTASHSSGCRYHAIVANRPVATSTANGSYGSGSVDNNSYPDYTGCFR